jgi:hypothetical protein
MDRHAPEAARSCWTTPRSSGRPQSERREPRGRPGQLAHVREQIFAQLGQSVDASRSLASFLKAKPNASLDSVSKWLAYADQGMRDHLLEGSARRDCQIERQLLQLARRRHLAFGPLVRFVVGSGRCLAPALGRRLTQSDHAFEVRLLLTVPPVRAVEARTVPSTAPAAAERP